MFARILLLALSFFCLKAQSQCIQYQGRCQADWMSQLSTVVKQRPLTRLKLMQSHNSGAYQLMLNATTPMEHFGLLDDAIILAEEDSSVEQFIGKVTFCQSKNIYEQLEQGIRSLDLRVLYNNILNEFFLSHSFATVPLRSALTQIQHFMTRHRGEILFMQMENDYEHTQETMPYNDQIISIVQSALGSLLLPVSANKMLNDTITLKSLTQSNKRILFSFSNPFAGSYNNVWLGKIINYFWPNDQTAENSLNTIRNNLPFYGTPQNKFMNSIFFTVTPSKNSILIGYLGEKFDCPVNNGIYDEASAMEALSSPFIRNHPSELAGLNIVSVDFPTDDYVQQIIDWNTL